MRIQGVFPVGKITERVSRPDDPIFKEGLRMYSVRLGQTPREIAICKVAHAGYMANLKAGLVYDVVKLAWVKPEDLIIKPKPRS